MCSILDFYSNSPDGVKALIIALLWLTPLAVLWLCTRRRTVIQVVPLTEVELMLRGYHRYDGEQDLNNHPPRLNPPKDRKEE
jgi:hypothetical protein